VLLLEKFRAKRGVWSQGERALFLACHRLCFAWIDEWHGMTMEQIREMERHTELLLKKVSVTSRLLSPYALTFGLL
jgi:hypothetical protein